MDTAIAIRKRPTQARSKEKVERILDAAAQILVDNGFEALNTVHVAEVSGVTVGSIYQYFPNKETILFELYQRWLDESYELYLDFARTHQDVSCPRTYFVALFRAFVDQASDTQHRLSVELVNALRVNKQLQALDLAHDKRLLKAVTSDLERIGPSGQQIAKHRTTFLIDLTLSLMGSISRAAPKDRRHIIAYSVEVVEKMVA